VPRRGRILFSLVVHGALLALAYLHASALRWLLFEPSVAQAAIPEHPLAARESARAPRPAADPERIRAAFEHPSDVGDAGACDRPFIKSRISWSAPDTIEVDAVNGYFVADPNQALALYADKAMNDLYVVGLRRGSERRTLHYVIR
jgi:hypothetical protein